MTRQIGLLGIGVAAALLAASGCGRSHPPGVDTESAPSSQQAAASPSTLRETTLNVTGMT